MAMLADILLHMGLEATGAFGLRCVIGMCDHLWHKVLAWSVFAFVSSVLTVLLVG